MNCHEAVAELMRSIDANTPTGEQAHAHLRECERCRALLASVSEQVPAEDVSVEGSAIAAEAAVAWERKKLLMLRASAICAVIIVFGLLMLIPKRREFDLGEGQFLLIAITGVIMGILFGAPVVLLFSAVSNARTSSGERRFYRRLGPGRWLEGVCLGIAEAMGWNVTFVRLAFVFGVWVKGLGLLAYIICRMAMPVHPGDRRYQLRFKIARLWRRMRHAADSGQQHG